VEPTRQTVIEDLPHVAKFIAALVPTMGECTLADVSNMLKAAQANEATLALVASAVLSAPSQPQEARRRA